MSRRWLMPLVGLWLGCFNPDLTRVPYACASSADCPDTFTCAANVCQPPGGDMMSADLVASNCTLFGAVYACRGAFDSGQAARLCPPNHHVCTDDDKRSLSNLDSAACDKRDEFFASFAIAATQFPALRCPAAMPEQPPILAGCGADKATQSFPSGSCYNLNRAIACKDAPRQCPKHVASLAHASARGGVLCCPM